YTDPGVLVSAMSADLRAEYLLDGGRHTAYLCAPAHEQRRLQPLFATLVQEIVAHAYERTTQTGTPLDPPLLLVLDECANIAPLPSTAAPALPRPSPPTPPRSSPPPSPTRTRSTTSPNCSATKRYASSRRP